MAGRLLLLGLLLCACAPKVLLVRATDAETGAPLFTTRISTSRSDIIATTDSLGLAPYPLGPVRNAVVSAELPGYFAGRWTATERSRRRGETLWIDVELYANLPRAVDCTAIDSSTGNPYSGAMLRFAGAETTLPARAAGSWLVLGFPAGPTAVVAEADGSKPETAEVVARGGETTEVRMVLLDTLNVGAVQGTVLDDSTGLVLAGVQVRVRDTPLVVATDVDGCYALPTVPVGRHVVEFELTGYTTRTVEFPLVRGWTIEVGARLRRK